MLAFSKNTSMLLPTANFTEHGLTSLGPKVPGVRLMKEDPTQNVNSFFSWEIDLTVLQVAFLRSSSWSDRPI